jgi:hypothetical protein
MSTMTLSKTCLLATDGLSVGFSLFPPHAAKRMEQDRTAMTTALGTFAFISELLPAIGVASSFSSRHSANSYSSRVI